MELAYSLANRAIEKNGILDIARSNHMNILAFSVLGHGRISNRPSPFAGPDDVKALEVLGEIAAELDTTVEKLAQAYVLAKNPDMRMLIGTTRKEHLQESMDALDLKLSEEDIARIESAYPNSLSPAAIRRNFVFRNGRMSQA